MRAKKKKCFNYNCLCHPFSIFLYWLWDLFTCFSQKKTESNNRGNLFSVCSTIIIIIIIFEWMGIRLRVTSILLLEWL
jgi:hypothetical protein